MNWLIKLINFVTTGFDKYDAFVKDLSIKHLWFASFLAVLGKIVFGIICVGVPAIIAASLVALFVKFVMVFPVLGGIAIAAIIIWIAMLFSAFELYAVNRKNPKKEKSNDDQETSIPAMPPINTMPGVMKKEKDDKGDENPLRRS